LGIHIHNVCHPKERDEEINLEDDNVAIKVGTAWILVRASTTTRHLKWAYMNVKIKIAFLADSEKELKIELFRLSKCFLKKMLLLLGLFLFDDVLFSNFLRFVAK
jgi:hypothetical protein